METEIAEWEKAMRGKCDEMVAAEANAAYFVHHDQLWLAATLVVGAECADRMARTGRIHWGDIGCALFVQAIATASDDMFVGWLAGMTTTIVLVRLFVRLTFRGHLWT